MDFRFRRSMRLVRRRDFQRTYSRGGRARGSQILVVAAANGTDTTRLGLSVGRAIWKSAVRRNRIRRLFREAFRLSYRELPRGVDLILVPARPKLVPELTELRKELVALSAKALSKEGRRRRPRKGREPAARGERKRPSTPGEGSGS